MIFVSFSYLSVMNFEDIHCFYNRFFNFDAPNCFYNNYLILRHLKLIKFYKYLDILLI